MQFSHFRVQLYQNCTQKDNYQFIIIIFHKILIDISGELHGKLRYDHIPRSLIQASLTTFVIV